ncbi:rhodopsin, GQ-coupled-like [Saccostrea echinata]|uniref:rhodopsin, GQ-coupled-like n=1 Tax=Saccostrea echinata TaxID=191078 RepID=UPI002A82BB75|nr:rhodopsin, GQ-coupled-like [Saccostrea echinata]
MDILPNSTGEAKVGSTWYTCTYINATYGKSSCWELDKCKPMTVFLQVLSIFGMLSNLTVFIVICAEKRLHKPLYTGIRMLTIPDALFLMCRFLIFTFTGMPNKVFLAIIYLFLSSVFSSIGHVILLSVQQYLMIAYPLKSLVWMRSKRVLIVSAIIWIFAAILSFPYVYLTFLTKKKEAAASLNLVYTVLLTVGPICVLGLLHTMKIIALKKSLVNNRNKTTRKVSQIISIVIGVYVITTTPINVRDIIEMSVCHMTDVWFIVLGHIGRTLLLVNYSINPYIYFISTPQFQRALCRCCGYKSDLHTGSRTNTQTESAHISSVRSASSSVSSSSVRSEPLPKISLSSAIHYCTHL